MVNKGAQVGIYKLTHKPTGKFYIGATTNLYKRWHTHKSHFARGKSHGPLQAVYNLTNDMNDWSMKMIKPCMKKTLQKNEEAYLEEYGSNPKCLNTHRKANVGRRDKKTNDDGRHHLASSLLGKNSKKGNILRPNNLTFIAPDGTEYSHVQSVKRFCEEHNLSQVQMNYVANGQLATFYGWTRKDSELPYAVHVQEYWSRERMLQNYPEYVIVAPDGTESRTWVISHYEEEHKCTVIVEPFTSKSGVKSNLIGLDEYGRGHRLKHIPYFDITYLGKTYHNVVSISKWGQGLGMTEKNIHYLLSRPPLHQIRPTKRTRDIQIKKIVPQ